MSRSTWACELKWKCCWHGKADFGHAPRERVSWNVKKLENYQILRVTLHVSVWVEIAVFSRSRFMLKVTLHVSVWVEMILALALIYTLTSRSTWACELKLMLLWKIPQRRRHAPRERVSWNDNEVIENSTINPSRSTWACELKCGIVYCKKDRYPVTLHVSVWVEIM